MDVEDRTKQETPTAAPGPRERYRQQVRAEVLKLAWQQVADAGPSGLSLNAIAKQVGVTGPALYRYFAGRDELLTELIVSAYRELAELVEAAAATPTTPAARLTAVATTIRAWALAGPHRYLLLYGTPVPGYSAPAEATALASRIFAPVQASYTGNPSQVLARSVAFWTRMHGVVSLEVAGHFEHMPFDRDTLFADEVASTLTGLRRPPSGRRDASTDVL